MTISDLSIKNPVFAWMLMFALMIFGWVGYSRMGVSQMPDVDFPIVNVAVTSGCDALHPGYGFMSENPDLCRACSEAGITFIGPHVDALVNLGDKTYQIDPPLDNN